MRTATRTRSNPATSTALAQVLKHEHERHAARLAEIRRISTKLPGLDDVLTALSGQGIHIDMEDLRPCRRLDERTEVMTLRAGLYGDSYSTAIARTLLALGFKVAWASQDELAARYRAEAIFRRGGTLVHVFVTPEWLTEAVELGQLTAATAGDHPANDVGQPMSAAAAMRAEA